MFAVVDFHFGRRRRYRNAKLLDHYLPATTSFFEPRNVCACEDLKDSESRKDMDPITSPENGAQHGEESCLSCLVVGVVTCGTLAGYFATLAYEKETLPELKAASIRRKPVFLAISAGWVLLGMYRVHLG